MDSGTILHVALHVQVEIQPFSYILSQNSFLEILPIHVDSIIQFLQGIFSRKHFYRFQDWNFQHYQNQAQL